MRNILPLSVFIILYLCSNEFYNNYMIVDCDTSSDFPSPYVIIVRLYKTLSRGIFILNNQNFDLKVSSLEISFYNVFQIILLGFGVTYLLWILLIKSSTNVNYIIIY